MDIKEGDTFLLSYPYDKKHLFIIVTKVENRNIACVMVSSIKTNSNYNDPSCILKPGDHPFIEHDSYIAYKETIVWEEAHYRREIEYGRCIPNEPVSADLLKKIKEAAPKSRKMPACYLKYYQ